MTDRKTIASVYNRECDRYRARELGARRAYLDGVECRELKHLLSNRPRTIDLGCGIGRMARYLRDRTAFYCGVDVAETLLHEAQRRSLGPRACFLLADAAKLPFTDGLFSLAVCNGLFEYVPDLRRYFEEVRRLLTVGSPFIFSCHTVQGALRYNREFGGYERVGHAPVSIDEVARATGFELVSIRPAFALPQRFVGACLRLPWFCVGAWLAQLDALASRHGGYLEPAALVVVARAIEKTNVSPR